MRKNKNTGYALLIVLLIIAVLTGMVTEFLFSTRLQAQLMSNHRDRMKARYLARSAINTYEYFLQIGELAPGKTLYGISSWLGYGSGFENVEGGDMIGDMMGMGESPISPSASGPLKGQWSLNLPSGIFNLEGGVYGRLVNERGKINLNAIVKPNMQDRSSDVRNEPIYALIRTLMLLRGVKDEDITPFLDGLVDWVDGNDNIEPEGAEDAYYQSLDEKYNARNDFLVSVEEIMLIKGCTPDIYERIKDFVTVYPRQGADGKGVPDERLDLVAAPKLVLVALFLALPLTSDNPLNDPDTASLVADEIYEKALEKASLTVTISGGQAQVNAGQPLACNDSVAIIAGRLQGNFQQNCYTFSPADAQFYSAIGGGQVNDVVSSIRAVLKFAQNKVTTIEWIEE